MGFNSGFKVLTEYRRVSKSMMLLFVRARKDFLTEKKKNKQMTAPIFSTENYILYIPSIFNKLCIKVRKTEN
jgi:hypothetical protein